MKILTVARRAKLGSILTTHFDLAKNNIEVGREYYILVIDNVTLTKEQLEFHNATFLAGVFSYLEALLNDIAIEFLVCYPGHLKDKNIALEDLAKSASISGAIRNSAESMLNKWGYDRFPIFMEKVAKLFDNDKQLDDSLCDDIAEIKATRDIYVHNGGIVNDTYYQKAGQRARKPYSGSEKLTIDKEYLMRTVTIMLDTIEYIDQLIPSKLRDYGKVSAFREMWNYTTLSELLPFEDGWIVEDESMLRPNDDNLNRYWSHSERPLVDFFIGIYSQSYPTRESDTLEALRRWPPDTNEGKVIISWMDSPFWF